METVPTSCSHGYLTQHLILGALQAHSSRSLLPYDLAGEEADGKFTRTHGM